MKRNVKTAVMLAIGCLSVPIESAFAKANTESVSPPLLKELIVAGELARAEDGKLWMSDFAYQTLNGQAEVVNDEQLLDQLEQSLKTHPQLERMLAGAVL